MYINSFSDCLLLRVHQKDVPSYMYNYIFASRISDTKFTLYEEAVLITLLFSYLTCSCYEYVTKVEHRPTRLVTERGEQKFPLSRDSNFPK
jgi:hypothetical protein